jgi:hypothetical protein
MSTGNSVKKWFIAAAADLCAETWDQLYRLPSTNAHFREVPSTTLLQQPAFSDLLRAAS